MKALRRAHARTYVVCTLLVGGCSVYEPALLDERAASSSGGAAAQAGDGGSGGGKPTTAGSAGSAKDGGTGSGATSNGGAPSANAGDAPTMAGGEMAGEGGAPPCVPEAPAESCTRLGKDCGSVDGTDNCGNPITLADCGTCSGLAKCGGGGEDNVCGALTDPALGGAATASSVMFIGEDGSKAFDLDITTKWFAGDSSPTGWLAYQFPANTTHVVTSYSITSANDVPTRDPAAWQLQGSSNGSAWITVDQQSSQAFSSRRQTISYECANATPYRWYRLLVTANSGASGLQLSELVLYGK